MLNTQPDIFDLIEDSHERVESLLDSLVARWMRAPAGAGELAPHREMLHRVGRELRAQHRAEERTLYASLPDDGSSDVSVRLALHQHRDLERRLDELERLSSRDVAREPPLRKLWSLRWLAEIHFAQEEDRVFENAREVLDDATAARLGRAWLGIRAG